MKKIISIISCLVITNSYAVNIELTGEGSNKDVKTARFLARSQIERQFKELPENPLKFSSIHREDEIINGRNKGTFTDNIVCNFAMQGREITGEPVNLNNKIIDMLDCKESVKGNTVKIKCVIDDNVLENFRKELLNNDDYRSHCHNRFHNEFRINGDKIIQDGIIFGTSTYKEYYDNGGTFNVIYSRRCTDYDTTTRVRPLCSSKNVKKFYFGNLPSNDEFHQKKDDFIRIMKDEMD